MDAERLGWRYHVERGNEIKLSEAEVIAFARQHLPLAKCPKVVVFDHEIPFTVTGKPKRIQLAQMLVE